jgi:hypothetical protein
MVDRLLLKMPVRLGPMARGSPKAQEYQAAESALFCQRVEDNAFHLGNLTRAASIYSEMVGSLLNSQR